MAKGEAGMTENLNSGYDGLAELLTRQLDRRSATRRGTISGFWPKMMTRGEEEQESERFRPESERFDR